MIDTDKYTGHTGKEWFIEPNGWEIYASVGYDICRVGGSPNRRVDAQLIADAPLLLAEVKRLRKELKEAKDVIQYALEMSNDDDSTRVFEDFLEVIK